MSPLFALAVAAAAPELGVAGVVSVADGGTGQPSAVGGAGHVGAPLRPRLVLEGAVDGGADLQGAPWSMVRPRLRAYLADPSRSVLSLQAGAGAWLDADPAALVAAGAALDLGRRGALRPRLQTEYTWTSGAVPWRLHLGVGVVWRRAAEEPVVPEPVVEVETESTRIAVEDAMVWVPGPVCEWLPPVEANASFQEHAMALADVTLISAPLLADPDADPLAPAEASREVGHLAISGHPGDTLLVDGEVVELGPDGTALVERDPGSVDLRIVGGGRTESWPVAVASGAVLWVSAGPAESTRVLFPVDSAVLDGAARARLAAIAEQAGDWSFTVYGSHSSEGQAARNSALADRRAAAVRDALVQAGVSPERLQLAEPAPPEEGLPPAEQRAAVVRPVLVGVL